MNISVNDEFVVVVGGDHYNTLWIVRSLGQKGITPYVIILSDKKSFLQKSRYIKESYIVSTPEKLIVKLFDLKRSNQKGFIFSSSDVCSEVIDSNYNALSEWYFISNVNNRQGSLSLSMDKFYVCEIATKSGFNVAKSWVINLNSIQVPESITYPCILKPRYSSRGSKSDFRICYNKEELKTELTKKNFTTNDILIQEYLSIEYDFSVLGVYLENTKLNIIPGTLYKTGTCGKINNLGMPTYAYVDKDISADISLTSIERFFELIPFRGLYSIEFVHFNGKAYFVELNLRVDGDLFVYTTAGINMPYIWIQDLKKQMVNIDYVIKDKTIGMTEISYFKHLKTKNPLRIIKDLFNTDCFSIFHLKDLKPFFYKILYYLQ